MTFLDQLKKRTIKYNLSSLTTEEKKKFKDYLNSIENVMLSKETLDKVEQEINQNFKGQNEKAR